MNDSIVQEPQLERDWDTMNEDTDKHVAVRRRGIDVAKVASTTLLLIVIVAMGAYFRLLNVNWDDDQHLHPDERFLTMVETAIQWPDSVAQYFNSAESPLNPYNRGHTNYVYGTLPLFMVKKLGMLLNQNGYGEIHFVGRVTSAIFDLGTVILVFLIGVRLYSRKVGLLGAFLMSLNVLHIQNSHFFTMDTILVFFTTLAFLFAVLIAEGKGLWAYIGAGLALGMAVACKISVAVFGGVIGLAWFIGLIRKFYPTENVPVKGTATKREHGAVLERAVIYILLTVLIALVTFRVFQPYAFEGPGFFDFKLDARFVDNMKYISKLVRGEIDYPPSHQWTNRKPIIFPLKNMILWGMGIPLGVTVWLGWAWAGTELLWRRDWRHLLPLAWTTAFFGYQGIQFVKAMRYIMPTYPMFILLGAYLLGKLANLQIDKGANQQRGKSANGQENAPSNIFARFADLRIRKFARFARFAYLLICLFGTLGWAWAFSRIYTRPVTRITASRWVYDNIPPGTTIANEHWDDPLPMRIDGKDGFGGMYEGIQLHLYAEDEPSKLENLLDWLDAADYIFITSNRLYDSIPRLPMRYPMTVKYYELLFAEKLGFERIKTFTSYPNIGPFEINDDKAEETFHVYDHPKVIIFEKITEGPRAFSREKVRELLGDVEWDKIERLWPKQVTERDRDNQPVFDEETWAEQRAGGTWRVMFNRNSFLNSNQVAAVIWWLLLLEIVSLLTFPLGALIFRRLADKGYILHKGLGLLLLTYISWMLVNLTPLQYTWNTIVIALVLMGTIAAVLTWLYRAEIFTFWRTKRNVILINEILFLLFFLAFMLIRWGNPDLWHPAMGGERPMDLAYLNAVIRSAEFPPYDPWFAGGKLNYYYYGQLIVATFIKFTGIVPWLAYNLTLPLFFAMTAMGAFCVVYNLQMGRWANPQTSKSANPPLSPLQGEEDAAVLPPVGEVRGGHSSTTYLYPLAAAFFVAVLGNLSELSVLGQGLSALSNINFESSIPGFEMLVRSIDGLRQWISNGGGELPVRVNWWYWNASRVMTHGEINEFPFFTFLYSDLHAHLMALPYTIIALGFALNWVLPAQRDEQVAPRNLPGAVAYLPFVLWVLVISIVLGALRCINTWDYPTYLFVTLLALGFAVYNQRGRLHLEGMLSIGIIFGAILVLSNVMFQPFHAHYAMPYSSLTLWKGDRTELWAYLTIHGLFLFVLVTYLLVYIGALLQKKGFTRWVDAATRKFDRLPRFLSLYDAFGPPFSLMQRIMTYGAVALTAVLIFLVTLAVMAKPPTPPRVSGYDTLALIIAILGVTALTLIYHFLKMWLGETETSVADIFILCLVALGAGLMLVVEIIVLKGDIGRMNTVFKFYLQVWVIWGIASAAALGRMGAWTNEQVGKSTNRQVVKSPLANWRWQVIFATLVFIAALYPIFATPAKVRDRFQADLPRTLDGRAYMKHTVYRAGCNGAGGRDVQYTVDMKWELEAINWLLDNIPGSPVILEGNTQPCLYQWGSRISSYTGLPTIVGWDWHQRQQRTMMPGGTVEERQRDVRTLYDTTDVNQTMTMLHKYDVEYIYVGELERAFYSAAGIDKFDHMRVKGLLDLVYENQEVRIYRVRQVG